MSRSPLALRGASCTAHACRTCALRSRYEGRAQKSGRKVSVIKTWDSRKRASSQRCTYWMTSLTCSAMFCRWKLDAANGRRQKGRPQRSGRESGVSSTQAAKLAGKTGTHGVQRDRCKDAERALLKFRKKEGDSLLCLLASCSLQDRPRFLHTRLAVPGAPASAAGNCGQPSPRSGARLLSWRKRALATTQQGIVAAAPAAAAFMTYFPELATAEVTWLEEATL